MDNPAKLYDSKSFKLMILPEVKSIWSIFISDKKDEHCGRGVCILLVEIFSNLGLISLRENCIFLHSVWMAVPAADSISWAGQRRAQYRAARPRERSSCVRAQSKESYGVRAQSREIKSQGNVLARLLTSLTGEDAVTPRCEAHPAATPNSLPLPPSK